MVNVILGEWCGHGKMYSVDDTRNVRVITYQFSYIAVKRSSGAHELNGKGKTGSMLVLLHYLALEWPFWDNVGQLVEITVKCILIFVFVSILVLVATNTVESAPVVVTSSEIIGIDKETPGYLDQDSHKRDLRANRAVQVTPGIITIPSFVWETPWMARSGSRITKPVDALRRLYTASREALDSLFSTYVSEIFTYHKLVGQVANKTPQNGYFFPSVYIFVNIEY